MTLDPTMEEAIQLLKAVTPLALELCVVCQAWQRRLERSPSEEPEYWKQREKVMWAFARFHHGVAPLHIWTKEKSNELVKSLEASGWPKEIVFAVAEMLLRIEEAFGNAYATPSSISPGAQPPLVIRGRAE